MLFRQLFDYETYTYTYLIADESTREAMIIDSVLEKHDRDMRLIKEHNLKLRYAAETHIHADHITGSAKLKEATGCEIMIPVSPEITAADKQLEDQTVLKVGNTEIKVLATPGHTNNDICFYVNHDRVLTGDTLFIRGCGRTDFQSGSAAVLYQSVHKQLFSLPDDTLVFPGHDYKGETCSTIGEEKAHNPRLKLENSEADFVAIMDDLNLPYPKKIDVALPRNQKCGAE